MSEQPPAKRPVRKVSIVTVTYNAVGSGTGKQEFGKGLTDFAGSDILVKDSDGVAAGSFLYVPTVAAPITVSYNLSGVDKLQLSPDTLAKIFQTDIKKWNDPAVAADNPGVTLPGGPPVRAPGRRRRAECRSFAGSHVVHGGGRRTGRRDGADRPGRSRR